MTQEWNTSQYRAKNFSDYLNSAVNADGTSLGHSGKLVHISGFMDYLSPAIQDIISTADLIIIQRNIIHQGVLDAIRYWQGLGKAFAVDLDDDYPGLSFANPAYAFWKQNSAKLDPPPLDMLEQGIRLTNALISPNKQILRDWSYACRGYYIPNYMRDEWWLNLPARAEMKAKLGLSLDRIVIGWGGSVSHYDSWWGSGLREAAVGIARAYPQVTFLICGNDPRIFNQLDVPLANKRYHPGVDPSEWPKMVTAYDIGVAPLAGSFDQRRSWIKTMEYGLAGVPWVASQGEPYREHAGLGMLVENTPEAWERALYATIENLASLQAKSTERVEFHREYLISRRIPEIVTIYRGIIANAVRDNLELPRVYRVNSSLRTSVLPEPTPEQLPLLEEPQLPQPSSTELANANYRHLMFLEHALPSVELAGVDILRAHTYDLIQLLNDAYLKEALA